jgi:hypothetical protein
MKKIRSTTDGTEYTEKEEKRINELMRMRTFGTKMNYTNEEKKINHGGHGGRERNLIIIPCYSVVIFLY